MTTICNLPDYAADAEYIVARRDDDGKLWFWGAYNDVYTAYKAAREISGEVVTNK